MARRKDYYGTNNKKSKDGMKVLEGFLKVAIWLGTIFVVGLINLIKRFYNSYQAKKNKK